MQPSLTVEPLLRFLQGQSEQPQDLPLTAEHGVVGSVGDGIATVTGLPNVGLEETVRLGRDHYGLVLTLERDKVGLILLDSQQKVQAGTPARRTGRVLSVPVGESLLGRMVDPLGRPLDGAGPLSTQLMRPVEMPAPPILDRSPVEVPLQTGIKVVDALLPIGRGQRELILGDRQTGKTSLALDTILHQRDQNVVCVYCAIGQRDSSVSRVRHELDRFGAFEYSFLVVARSEDPPGTQYLAPYAATSMAEWFMHQGRDVLIVYDDLTHHARAYRELSLLLRRPPGREAFPGDIFYIHSRLLERSTRLRRELGGGSLTALPIASLEGEGLASYIPTNLISITDGQIILSSQLFRKGQLPAVDVGRSVSRVGGDAQLRAYRSVISELRLEYAQFEELETFARFDTRLSESTLKTLERGRRIREVLRQPRYRTLNVTSQIALMLAATEGLLDRLPVHQVETFEIRLVDLLQEKAIQLKEGLETGEPLDAHQRRALLHIIEEALSSFES